LLVSRAVGNNDGRRLLSYCFTNQSKKQALLGIFLGLCVAIVLELQLGSFEKDTTAEDTYKFWRGLEFWSGHGAGEEEN
jgi:hypothetical protein